MAQEQNALTMEKHMLEVIREIGPTEMDSIIGRMATIIKVFFQMGSGMVKDISDKEKQVYNIEVIITTTKNVVLGK